MTHSDPLRARSLPGSRIEFRFFSSAPDAPRARRPTDALLLVLSVLTVVVTTASGAGSQLSEATAAFVRALPGLLDWFWGFCDTLIVVWAVTLIAAALVAKGRLSLIRDQSIALAVAIASGILLLDQGVSFGSALFASGTGPIFPAIRLAVSVAVLATSSPHLGRPVRRVGRWLILLGSLSAIALGVATPLGVAAGLAIGAGASAVVHLLLGSPGGIPTPDHVRDALVEMGLDVTGMSAAELGRHGVAILQATDAHGHALLVKVYGRDAWGGQLFSVVWSYLWYRDDRSELTLSRLQLVEHEAFLTLMAERAGARVLPVRAAGMAETDAVIVINAEGPTLAERRGAAITDAYMQQVWRSFRQLHGTGIAHGAIDERHLVMLPAGSPAIGGFEGATAAASRAQMATDRAQLLVTLSSHAGTERAIRVALAELGPSQVAETLPYLQTATMTPTIRSVVKDADVTIDDIRSRTASAAATDVPRLEPIRRVTWGSAFTVVALVLASWALITAFSHVGISTVTGELGAADDAWLWGALLFSQSIWIAEAFSTLGACPRPLPLGAVIWLQFAIRFIALAVPTSAARVALNVRFFQRAGLSTSPAIAVGIVDSVAGFVVQVLLLVTIWLAGLSTLTLSLSVSLDFSSQAILAIVIVLAIGLVLLIRAPRVRRAIGPRVTEATEALQVLRTPTKLLLLFGGNVVAQVLMAITLSLCLRAFGWHTSLANLILINTLASLFSGIMPIPGGIGVMEAALGAGLVAAGIPESVAFATTIAFRLATFYLPPIWGAYAMRVLRKREYL
jgi:uncharacterized membrane protein YbhN (UPF0104 family)